MDEELKEILKSIDNTLKNIEKILTNEEKSVGTKKKKIIKKNTIEDYTGLTGGIRLLIDNRFLDKPREMKEIVNELKREGYHYPDTSTFKILSVDFLKKSKTLSRLKVGRNYKYVLRK